jgi:hypothetical protein
MQKQYQGQGALLKINSNRTDSVRAAAAAADASVLRFATLGCCSSNILLYHMHDNVNRPQVASAGAATDHTA